MSFLDGILGGLVSAGVSSVIGKVLNQSGGVQGLVSQFEQKGLGSLVQSWVGTGENKAVEPAQIQHVMGNDTLAKLAQESGLSVEDLTEKLASILPQAVDKMTPNGVIAAAA